MLEILPGATVRKMASKVIVWLENKLALLGGLPAMPTIIGFPVLILGGTVAYFQIINEFHEPDVLYYL